MPYIGNQTAESFTSFATQEFSTSATTSYTLDHAVTNENEIALFINNVRQQPGSGKAYTATGTALTLSAATASTDTMYCVFLGRALQTVNPAGGSIGSSQLSADAITGQTALTSSPDGTDELLISDAGTLKRIDVSLVGGANTPFFYGELASDATLSRATLTKITGLTQAEQDSDTAFDGTTFTVPSGKGGTYYLEGTVTGNFASIGQDGENTMVQLYKNGSAIKASKINQSSSTGQNNREITITASGIFALSASDTVELYGELQDANASGNATVKAGRTSITGFKLIS